MASAKILQILALLLDVEVLAVGGTIPSEIPAAASVSNCVASISFVYNAPNSICMRTDPPTQAYSKNPNKSKTELKFSYGASVYLMVLYQLTIFLLVQKLRCTSSQVYNPTSQIGMI